MTFFVMAGFPKPSEAELRHLAQSWITVYQVMA
jgi:hypothetical protein